jgi:DNA gyrase subunit A
MVTASGYVKRLSIKEFEAQSRGGKGKAGTKFATEDDQVVHFFACNDHDAVVFITDKYVLIRFYFFSSLFDIFITNSYRGIAYSVKAHQIPLLSRVARGTPLPQVLSIAGDETVTSVIPVSEFREDESLVLLTEQGYVKKTPLKAFKSIQSRGLIIITLGKGDSLRWARICESEEEEVLIATKDGYASRFSSMDLTSMGRAARGVRALTLRPGDRMADMDIFKGSNTSMFECCNYEISCIFQPYPIITKML